MVTARETEMAIFTELKEFPASKAKEIHGAKAIII
jgi:hypothetical protein